MTSAKIIRIFTCSVGFLVLSSGLNAAQKLAAVPDVPSANLVKTADVAGVYRGRVLLPEGFKPAVLTLSEDLAGANFLLQVQNQVAIKGRLAGFFLRSKNAYASLKVFENGEPIGATETSGLSLRLLKTDDGIRLTKDSNVLFETCPRHPKCLGVGGCEPCEP